jgi:hypothetical protein
MARIPISAEQRSGAFRADRRAPPRPAPVKAPRSDPSGGAQEDALAPPKALMHRSYATCTGSEHALLGDSL